MLRRFRSLFSMNGHCVAGWLSSQYILQKDALYIVANESMLAIIDNTVPAGVVHEYIAITGVFVKHVEAVNRPEFNLISMCTFVPGVAHGDFLSGDRWFVAACLNDAGGVLLDDKSLLMILNSNVA